MHIAAHALTHTMREHMFTLPHNAHAPSIYRPTVYIIYTAPMHAKCFESLDKSTLTGLQNSCETECSHLTTCRPYCTATYSVMSALPCIPHRCNEEIPLSWPVGRQEVPMRFSLHLHPHLYKNQMWFQFTNMKRGKVHVYHY